ncbi:MAG: fatty acyl-AMP ligase [Phycisphaera sp.]|nr:fatty acyl-AMP ligase [Phycisphaera sp.]
MSSSRTIPELLFADPAPPTDHAVTRLGRNDRPELVLRRGELLREVERVARSLHDGGFAGRPVLIPERNGIEYVVGFLACLRAGCMAVTAHPPRAGGGGERLAAIVRNSRPAAVLATPGILETIDRMAPELLVGVDRLSYEAPAVPVAEADGPAAEPILDDSLAWPDPEAVGLLQYTSGSTRDPAPVAITQGNLLANGLAMRDLFTREGRSGGTVCWMPLYHDMGLIGLMISSLLVKIPFHLMEPEAFAMRPIRWLRAMSNTRASYSGGPCFAYDLCVSRTTEEDRAGLDLSNWRFAFNGAEPIKPESLAQFQRTFGPRGFRGMMPCYGLAEHTLLVSVRREDEPIRYRIADRTALDQGRLAVDRTIEIDESTTVEHEPGKIGVVACGPGIPGHEIVVRDPSSGQRLEEGRIGEVTLRGPSVASGYHGRDELTADTFPPVLGGDPGPWLRTGDLGAMFEGDLHVLGRLKDLVIVDGRNVHPADVEGTLESSHPSVDGGRIAVFAVGDVLAGESETITVVVELGRAVHRDWRRDPDAATRGLDGLFGDLRGTASSVHGIRLSRIVVVGPGGIPRTTSGKIRRAATREALAAGDLQVLHEEDSRC